MIDLFGHVGYLLIALGMWRLSKLDGLGWALRLIGEAIWVIIGVVLGMTSIIFWGIVFMLIDMYGIYRWSTNEN